MRQRSTLHAPRASARPGAWQTLVPDDVVVTFFVRRPAKILQLLRAQNPEKVGGDLPEAG
jgi:hypothetical protein